uniref:proteoglycan 4-like isoform X14 n=1 Tax=Semicossyphus pulcher TaxID=241346 RepID=UPI0037E9BE3B
MVLKTLALFFALLCSAARTDNAPETVYKAKGDEVVLMPTDKAPPFPDIEWKHGNDIAAELDNGKTKCFGQFKDRCTLNNSTGELTITGLTVKDNGLYTLKINGKDTNTKIQLNVISPVSKPTISKSCNPEMTYCDLICESNTTDAEPITYIWVAGDSVGPLSRVFKITKDMKEDSFRCILVNPLGREERSESIPNPFKPSAPVSKPIISQSCNPEMTYCDLTCEGSATDAEPITYKWVAGDSVGPLSRSRVFKITKDMEEDSFSCIMVDPFGREEHSESIPNPFKTSGVLNRSHISTIIVVAAVILLILYFIFKYIKEESRIRLMKRAEDNGWKAQKTTDVEEQGTPSEAVRMLEEANEEQPDRVTGQQRAPAVLQNGGEMPSGAAETSNQDQASAASPQTTKEAEMPSGAAETSTQDLTSAASPQTTKEAVVPGGLSQEPPQAAAPDTSEDKVVVSAICHPAPDQDLTSAASPNTSKETEMPSGVAETSTQDQASAASPQTTKEAEMPSGAAETSTQDLTSAASPQTTKEAAPSTPALSQNDCSGLVVPGGLSQEPPQAAAPDTSEDKVVVSAICHPAPDQDLTSAASPNTSKETEMPSGAAETSTQDQASAASPQTTKEAEMPSGAAETSTQDLTSAASPQTTKEAAPSTPALSQNDCSGLVVPGGLSQEPPQAAAPDTSEDKVVVSAICHPAPDQDLTSAASPNTSKETEMPSGVAETSTQDQASAASPQTTKEAEMPSGAAETSTQDLTSAASPQTTKEAENSAEELRSQETPKEKPPVDEQETDDPRDGDKC